ncbi:MAG TPA: TetR/AcrR family transcriptional regulator [Candidatus Dormibacteraeota bacterium]|nr:TetR/AcrR family transcriptional regulator [Candidatus Dormibacteraeota bacterium]
MARRYRLKARAESRDHNRRRIVEAAYQLHMTIGASRATASAIARLAGVRRPTVQRHFPDLASLFIACSLHGMQLDPPPDPAAWQSVADPGQRLLRALLELYPYYRRNRAVFADMPNFEGVPGLEALWAAYRQQAEWQRSVLAEGWRVPEDRQDWLLAALGHAIDFWSWCSLSLGQSLDDEKAALVMTEMVQGIVRSPADANSS